MALSTRQPFAELGSPRMQYLSSTKNRQNAIAPSFTSPLKQTTPSTGKRRHAPSVFEEEDSENMDPSLFNSPTKKSKHSNEGFSKPAQFSIFTSPSKPSVSMTTTPSIPSVRKALSSPNTTKSTPINHSRGSPKHKRVGLLSKRRASSSPFRRVDPPSFSHSSPTLPFSIDAALSGTIPNYTPKSTIPTPTPSHISALEESMPSSWFFDIHEDTPEEEAANLMEHSASVLDISSDDDADSKRRNEESERGKENIPPPDFVHAQALRAQASGTMDGMLDALDVPIEHVKRPRLRKIAQDAMDEDRSPLSDLPAAEFYGEGLDATSYVTVDAGIEKPSCLSKEFDFGVSTPPTPEKEVEVDGEGKTEEPPTAEKEVEVFADENTENTVPSTMKEAQQPIDVASESVELPVSAS